MAFLGTIIMRYNCSYLDDSLDFFFLIYIYLVFRWDLNVHLRLHKREIVCSRCDKAFTTKSKLERHSRVHTGEKPFYCTYCDKNFGDKRNLDNHLRTHTGVKPFSCSICAKTFSVQSHMVEHLNVHKKTAAFS